VFGDGAGVCDALVAHENEEAFVGEEETLVLLLEEGVEVLSAFDRLQVRLLLYLLLQLLAYQSPLLALLVLHFTYYRFDYTVYRGQVANPQHQSLLYSSSTTISLADPDLLV
jgi:hypothetical protein